MALRVVVNVEPPMLGELLARALREPLADVKIRLVEADEPNDHLTVAICTEEAIVPPDADVVVWLGDATTPQQPAGVIDDRIAPVSGDAEPTPFADLPELVQRLRGLALRSGL